MRNHWLFSTWLRLFVAGALLMTLLIGVTAQANALGASTIIALTNTQRTNNGLSPLAYNAQLTSSASAKAQDMLAKGYWAHTAPDGLTPWTLVSQAGYAYIAVGENLARDFGSDSAVVSGWMASPGHRANILNAQYRDIGIAVASGSLSGAQTTIVVAHFGATTAAPAPAPKPAPAPQPKVAKPTAATTSIQSEPVQAPQPATEETTSQPVVESPKPKSPRELLIEDLVALIQHEDPSLVTSG